MLLCFQATLEIWQDMRELRKNIWLNHHDCEPASALAITHKHKQCKYLQGLGYTMVCLGPTMCNEANYCHDNTYSYTKKAFRARLESRVNRTEPGPASTLTKGYDWLNRTEPGPASSLTNGYDWLFL